MQVAQRNAVVALLVAAVLGLGSQAIAQSSKKKGPSEKWGQNTISFVNNTGADITLNQIGSACMLDAGPSSYTVKNGVPGWFNVTSDDNCNSSPQEIVWQLSSGGRLQLTQEFKAGGWQTQIQGNVHFAQCNNVNCLSPAFLPSGIPGGILIAF